MDAMPSVAQVTLVQLTRIAIVMSDALLESSEQLEGQVRKLQNMVEDDRYCADIPTQISSVHEAFRAVVRKLMRYHLEYCTTSAMRVEGEEASAMYDELVDLMV